MIEKDRIDVIAGLTAYFCGNCEALMDSTHIRFLKDLYNEEKLHPFCIHCLKEAVGE